MKCPNCLAFDRLYRVKKLIPWYLFFLRPFVVRLRCDCCLMAFYRLRGVGFMVRDRR